MTDNIIYKAKIKLKKVENVPSSTKEVKVLALLQGSELGQSSTKKVINGEASWDLGENIANIGKDQKRVRIRVLDSGHKDSLVGECFIDIQEYVLNVKPGTAKKFQISKSPEAGGTLCIKLSLSIMHKSPEDKQNIKITREKKRSSSKAKTNSESNSISNEITNLKKAGSESAASQLSFSSKHRERMGSKEALPGPPAHVLLSDYPNDKSATASRPISFATKTSAPKIDDPRNSKLVQRPTTPFVTKSKYPTLPTSTVLEEKRTYESSSTKFPTWGKDQSDVNNAAILKMQYALQKQLADERFLIDNITTLDISAIGDAKVLAFIIFKSLVHWEAFISNPDIQARIFDACKKSVKIYEGSRTMLYYWLSVSCILLCLGEERALKISEESYLADFIKYSKDLITCSFEAAQYILKKRLDPILKPTLVEVSTTPTDKMGKEFDALNKVFSILSDYSKLDIVIDEIKIIFYKRFYHFLASSILDAMVHDGTTYSEGIQTKMIISKLEEWTRAKLGNTLASITINELEPARQAANVLCLLRKADLEQEALRKAVCPLLRPTHILHILRDYRTDQYDKDGVPNSLLILLKKLESTFNPNEDTFDPKKVIPLTFDFQTPYINLAGIILPKIVLDRPGFAFLKNYLTIKKQDSKQSPGEKW